MKKRIIGLVTVFMLLISTLGGCTSSNGLKLTKALINNYDIKNAASESNISLVIKPNGLEIGDMEKYYIDLINNSNISFSSVQDIESNKAIMEYAVKLDDITYNGNMYVDGEKVWLKIPMEQKYIKYDPVDLVPEDQKEEMEKIQKQSLQLQEKLLPVIKDFIIDYIRNNDYVFDKLENKGVSTIQTPEGSKQITTYQLAFDFKDIASLLKHTGNTVDEMINDDTLKELVRETFIIASETMPEIQEEVLAEFDKEYEQFKQSYISEGGKEDIQNAIEQMMTMIEQYCEIGSEGIVIRYGVDNEDNVVKSDLVVDLVLKNMGMSFEGEVEPSLNITLKVDSVIYNINKTNVVIPEFAEDEVITMEEFAKSNEMIMNSPYASMFGVENRRIILSIGSTYAYISGEGSSELDAAPFIKDDTTMVPVKFIGDALGATVDWRDSDKAIIYTADDINIVMNIGSKTAYVNGEPVELTTEPVIVNERTMIPLRFVSEQLGANVEWDEEYQMITIEKIM